MEAISQLEFVLCSPAPHLFCGWCSAALYIWCKNTQMLNSSPNPNIFDPGIKKHYHLTLNPSTNPCNPDIAFLYPQPQSHPLSKLWRVASSTWRERWSRVTAMHSCCRCCSSQWRGSGVVLGCEFVWALE